MQQCCVCRRRRRRLSSVTLCIVAKRCVLERRIKVTSTFALHLTLNLSETIKDGGLVTMEHQ